ncbi:substrate-binding domain-containing protein [Fundidesulfovibrio soli]|uniref:substrate-binding domain-containing protein n=1 Tax=Fundidesulfovibrio soli TaxID=2922716 RepID=UPI001FAF707E|nr:substrate-binding domain-containing protein [Fundidesulfovibrio soli]
MDSSDTSRGRRDFLKSAAASTAAAIAGAVLPVAPSRAAAGGLLQVWSCGGLAEAMIPANQAYEARTGCRVAYTGAFAAALGKSLLGSAETDVFAGRVLDLAKKLRQTGKMVSFSPLCFTSYVLVTPKGNPARIASIEDMARPGVRVVLAPEASPPGGAAAIAILKKSGVHDQAMANAVSLGSCVQRTMDDVISGKGDVSIVELRVTRLPGFAGKLDVVPIDAKFFPPPPLTFTIGVMKSAKDRSRAQDYVEHMLSSQSQATLERAGFIPAVSDKGRELTEKLGVKDV